MVRSCIAASCSGNFWASRYLSHVDVDVDVDCFSPCCQPITYARWNLPDEAKSVLPQYEKALGVNVVNDLEYLENTVKTNGSGYIYGNDLSLADIMTAFSAQFVLARGLGAKWEDDSYPTVKDWIRRLMKRDAWKRAVNQGEDSYTLDKETP